MAEPLLDVAAQRRLQTLVKKATDKRAISLDPELLRDIKGMCRVDDANVHTAFDAISEALKANHSQTRLMAVELADVLFRRSRVFRVLLAPRLAAFLVSSVGYRADAPLPGPADAAGALRQRTLAALEGWNEQFGSMYHQRALAALEGRNEQTGSTYHQVALGCNYLKNTLKYQFPEVASRAAAVAVRQTAAANGAFARIRDNFDAGMADMTSTLQQLEEAVTLAEAPTTAAAADAADEMGWTDAAAGNEHEGVDDEDEEAGLAAYADDRPAEPTQNGHAAGAVAVPTDVDAALAETIVGLQRLLTGRHLPTLRRWLDVFSKADPGPAGSSERAARDALLRQALQQRAQIDGALAILGAARVRVPALGAAMDAAETERAPAAVEAAAAGAGATAAGGADTSSTPEEDAELLASARRHAALRDPAAPASPWTLDSRFAGKQPKAMSPATKLAQQMALSGKVAAAALPPAGQSPARDAAAAAEGSGCQRSEPRWCDKASVPSDVKRRLLQSAPVIAAGGHLAYWDSGSGTTVTARSGMEISNHWGAVDHDTTISLAHLEHMAVNHVPEYYTPAAVGGSVAGGSTEGHAAQPRPKPQPGVTRIGGGVTRIGRCSSSSSNVTKIGTASGAAAAAPRGLSSDGAAKVSATALQPDKAGSAAAAAAALLRELAAPAQPAAAAAEATAGGNAPPDATAGAGGDAAAAGGGAAARSTDTAGRAPAASAAAAAAASSVSPDAGATPMAAAADRRAARAHNDAVLAGARNNEEVARSIAQQEQSGSESDKKRKRGGKKESLFGRLSKKLAAAESHKEPRFSIPGKDMTFFR